MGPQRLGYLRRGGPPAPLKIVPGAFPTWTPLGGEGGQGFKMISRIRVFTSFLDYIYIDGFIYEKAVINMVSGDSSRELHTISSFTTNIGFASHYDCGS